MEVRKLQLIGGSSFMVSLPKNWIRENTLKQGDEIVLSIDGRHIKLSPKRTAEDEVKKVEIDKIIKYDDEFLFRFILSLYLLGFDEIIIRDTTITPRIAVKISEIVKKLNGVEITHASDERIILRCFVSPEMDSTTLLYRMAEIVMEMIDSIDNALMFRDFREVDSAVKLEEDSDRLYYLTTRYENKISKLTSESNDKLVAKALEEIADSLAELSLGIREYNIDTGKLINLLREIKGLFQSSFQAYIEKDIRVSESVMNNLKKVYPKINEAPCPLKETYRCMKVILETAFNDAIRKSVIEYL